MGGIGGRFQKRPGASKTNPRTAVASTARGPRCANCGGAHNKTECNKPMVDPSKRVCFNCGKEGHRAAQCPEGAKSSNGNGKRLLKALSDVRLPIFGVLDEAVDHFGFQLLTKGARPKPQTAVLGDFIANRNQFEALLGDTQTYKARNKMVQPIAQLFVAEGISGDAHKVSLRGEVLDTSCSAIETVLSRSEISSVGVCPKGENFAQRTTCFASNRVFPCREMASAQQRPAESFTQRTTCSASGSVFPQRDVCTQSRILPQLSILGAISTCGMTGEVCAQTNCFPTFDMSVETSICGEVAKSRRQRAQHSPSRAQRTTIQTRALGSSKQRKN